MRIVFHGPNYDQFTADLTGAELEVLTKIAQKAVKLASYPSNGRIILAEGDNTALDLDIALDTKSRVITKTQADLEDSMKPKDE